ncbi:hypothetical protein [Lacinutrix mariniflava]|uniref:hypothetical protein n=1 Tax=Lacinutrix mariniflava TaxID=342955 RepID=UPI0006E44608|nr:hypothetical protein [Lacinutrix mariniflava]
MMVTPQIPYFRLATIVTGFLFLIVSILSVSGYLDTKDENKLLEQEKTIIISELSEMIDSYDAVDVVNDSLGLQLNQAKERLLATMDSVKSIKPNEALISRYKLQLKNFKIKKENIISLVNNLKSENEFLKIERRAFNKVIKLRDSINDVIELKYAHLLEERDKLKAYDKLFISNVNVEGVKRITSRNRIVDTRYARKVKKFHIEFTLVKNRFLTKGPKVFYFQILDSKMNIIADKGTVEFNEKSLIYSGKKTVNYKGGEITVSAIISKEKEEKLTSGVYFISIIHKGEIISKTSTTLK